MAHGSSMSGKVLVDRAMSAYGPVFLPALRKWVAERPDQHDVIAIVCMDCQDSGVRVLPRADAVQSLRTKGVEWLASLIEKAPVLSLGNAYLLVSTPRESVMCPLIRRTRGVS